MSISLPTNDLIAVECDRSMLKHQIVYRATNVFSSPPHLYTSHAVCWPRAVKGQGNLTNVLSLRFTHTHTQNPSILGSETHIHTVSARKAGGRRDLSKIHQNEYNLDQIDWLAGVGALPACHPITAAFSHPRPKWPSLTNHYNQITF